MTDATQVEADGGADGDGVVLGATAWGGMDWDRDPHMRIINHVLSIGMCSVVVVVSVVWLLARRNHEPLKSRSLGLMLAQIAAPALVAVEGVFRAVNDGKPNCEAVMIIAITLPTVLLMPGLLAAYRTWEMRRLQNALARLGADVDLAFVKRQKFRASWRMSARVLAATTIGAIIFITIRAVMRPDTYFTGDPVGTHQCDASTKPADGAVTLLWTLILVVPYYVAVVRLRNLRADFFMQTTELKTAGLLSLFFLVVWALMVGGPLRDFSNRVVHAVQLSSVWACGIVGISVIAPAVLTHSKRFQRAGRARAAFKSVVMGDEGSDDGSGSEHSDHEGGALTSSHSPKRMSPAATPVGSWTPRNAGPSPVLGASSVPGSECRDERVMRRWAVRKAKSRIDEAIATGQDPALALDLSVVLAIPITRKLFAEHLELEFSAESLLFWTMSSTDRVVFDAARTEVSVHERRRWLMTTFIMNDAPMQVNIGDRARRAIEKAIANEAVATRIPESSGDIEEGAGEWAREMEAEAAVRRAFDNARKEVFRLMEADSWPRFSTTVAFRRGVALLQELPEDVAFQSMHHVARALDTSGSDDASETCTNVSDGSPTARTRAAMSMSAASLMV
mmetsp:Transcript_17239/g.60585  ORF Transcript_17239/g.60585 Transcript_17239/m.60585 type:complete len:620 (-) Transcript_17239:183-2042(-)